MLVNADFRQPALLTPEEYRWVSSPQAGVERVMLDRMGAESGRATSVVRYAPRSHFPRHTHHGGEEILVLSGTFSDDSRDYPAGWYLRNPPGSSHQPSSAPGTVILVKLWQMRTDEQEPVRINTGDPANWGHVNGRLVCPLYQDRHERVRLVQLPPGDLLFRCPVEGAEFFVLEGQLRFDDRKLEEGSWARLPHGQHMAARAGKTGAKVYLKTGHLIELIGNSESC